VIAVEPERLSYDLEIPLLPRMISRSAGGLNALGVDDIPARQLALPSELRSEVIDYTGRDLLTGRVVERAEYPVPLADDPGAVLAWYVNEIQRDTRLTGQFAVLAPLVKGWVERRAFGGPVDFGDPLVLRQLAEPSVQETVLGVFREALDQATLITSSASAGDVKALRLSGTRPFLWSGEVAAARKSVFSAQPCDSGLESRFVGFLDRCRDVDAFAKLAREVRFSLEYRGDRGRLAYYYPDFVARLADGGHLLVETKGQADLEVPHKDARARRWATDATATAGVPWQFVRVDEELFDDYAGQVDRMSTLVDVVEARRRATILERLSDTRPRTREELLAIMEESTAKSAGITGIDDSIRHLRENPRGT